LIFKFLDSNLEDNKELIFTLKKLDSSLPNYAASKPRIYQT
jgi:hypothetical protein